VSLSDALKRLGLAGQRDESGGLRGHTLHPAYVGSKLKFALIRASRTRTIKSGQLCRHLEE
jgi:hypothetical protein